MGRGSGGGRSGGGKSSGGPLSPKEFADRVNAAAASAPDSAKFGGVKTFISEVHSALASDPQIGKLSVPEFHAALLAGHAAGHLELTRADLVSAMNPALVQRSALPMPGQTRDIFGQYFRNYHFVRFVKGALND